MDKEYNFPPSHLIKRVHGWSEVDGFINVGKIVSSNIYDSILNRLEPSEKNKILDFGCGCGRVIRYLKEIYDGEYHGVDIDGEAIEWCAENLDFCKFYKNDFLPPLPFDDNYFDFVFSISVFTHLPEDMQFKWLSELKRITKPNSYLILTTHGESLFDSTGNEFLYVVGSGTDGLPDFYHTTYHTKKYILEKWSEFFYIEDHIEKGIAGHQDLIVCKNIKTDI